MVFNSDNIKYCLLSFDHYEEKECNDFGNGQLPISGLFNWANIFNGKRMFPRTPEEFSQFNLFHINITSKNLFLLTTFLKHKPQDTKLLINVDFSIELWNQNFPYPDVFLDQINKADYIFAVEPTMASILSDALKRNVPCIPHPVDTIGISEFRSSERLNQIGVALHRYDNNFLLPYFIIKDLAPSFQSVLIGSTTESKQNFLHMYDFILENCEFHKLIKTVSELYAVVESYTIHSYGRLSAECAALGVPCIGSESVYSIQKCFPLLTTKTNDIVKQKEVLNNLINDSDFYQHVALAGIDNSKHFSFSNCKKLMLDFLNDSK